MVKAILMAGVAVALLVGVEVLALRDAMTPRRNRNLSFFPPERWGAVIERAE